MKCNRYVVYCNDFKNVRNKLQTAICVDYCQTFTTKKIKNVIKLKVI